MVSCPNIVLITVDCLRADHVGCYGYQDAATPRLDQLAAEGTLFLQAIAQGPGTTFAFPAIMSSIYPSMLGGSEILTASHPVLAERLQEAGYATAAFVSNPYLTASFGYQRGFVVFDECYSPKVTARRLRNAVNRILAPLGISIQCPPYPSAAQMTARACEWLARTSAPFFLWVHYMDTHWPYNLRRCMVTVPWDKSTRVLAGQTADRLRNAPASATQEEIIALKAAYDSGIRYVDHRIGQLLDMLKVHGLVDETWVVVTADHGEEFGDHGGFFHTRKLYDELIRVPLIVRFPKCIAMPRRVRQQVRHIDIAPTFLDVLGLPADERSVGSSLLPLLKRTDLAGLPAVSEVPAPEHWRLSLRQEAWKLILDLHPESLDVLKAELYHLQADPHEQRDLAPKEEQVVIDMQARLLETAVTIREQVDKEVARRDELDEEVVERLKALGYIG